MQVVIAVAVGGALGSLARYFLATWVARWLGSGFPFGTLAVNVLGSFVMGVLVELMALRWGVGPVVRAFMTVGFLGGFTTFSAFSLDVALLVGRGTPALAAGYVAASVVASIAGLFAGILLLRAVLA
ncbi:MAG: fluoride efflux transporter CrcB [Alphaproteobacteria bacterium]|nr:fluoride efflux transporter CrcB [Alphaproteobacteria bacterium]